MTALGAGRIAEIRKRLAAATGGGDWYWHPYMNGGKTLASPGAEYDTGMGFKSRFHELNVLKTTDDWPPNDDDAALIAHAPTDLADLLAEIERLTASERNARAELDSIRRRIERLHNEDWWIGGAWGDYGEAVIPLRALSTLDGPLDPGSDPKWETDPGFAATYRDCRATIEAQESRIAHLLAVAEAAREVEALAGVWIADLRFDSTTIQAITLSRLCAALAALDSGGQS